MLEACKLAACRSKKPDHAVLGVAGFERKVKGDRLLFDFAWSRVTLIPFADLIQTCRLARSLQSLNSKNGNPRLHGYGPPLPPMLPLEGRKGEGGAVGDGGGEGGGDGENKDLIPKSK